MSTWGTRAGRGENLSTTSTTTLVVTLTASVAAGELLLAQPCFDGYTGSDPVFTDSQGNTWATAFTRKGTSNTVVGVALGWTVVANPLSAGDTVTVTFGASVTAKVMQLNQIDLSLAGETVQMVAATHAIGATTALSTGTEANTDRLSGDLLIGVTCVETNAGMGDNTGGVGTWANMNSGGTTNTSQYKTASGGAAANVSSVMSSKQTTDTTAQTMGQTLGSALDWATGFARFRIVALSVTQAAYRFYGSGTESGSTAVAAQDTAASTTVTNSSTGLSLRVRLQNGTVAVPATTDFEVQFARNGGAWTAVGSGGILVASNGLTDASVTTNRLTGGSGSFVAGRVTINDSIAENVAITASNFTEVVYGLTFDRSVLADGDVITFRVLLDGAPLTTYSVTPTVNVVKVAPTVTEAAYGFYADGTETGSTTLAAQDTAPSVDLSGGDVNLALRIREQLTNASNVDADTDWQLQYERNASGTWVDVTTSSTAVQGFASASLTDQGATTRRLTVGTGTFFAGKVSEDGLADNQFLQSGLYTELLYSLTLKAADLANADTLRFRVVPSMTTVVMTRSSVPTLTVVLAGATPQSDSDAGSGVDDASLAILQTAAETGTATDDAASMSTLGTATETAAGTDDAAATNYLNTGGAGFVDTFDRADTTSTGFAGTGLGTDWNESTDTHVASNAAKRDGGGFANWWVATAPGDQYAEVDLANGSNTDSGVMLRGSSNDPVTDGYGSCYVGMLDSSTGGAKAWIMKYTGNSFVGFLADQAITATSSPCTLRLTAVGSTLTLYRDGVQVATATDSSHTGAYVGLQLGGTDGRALAWRAGVVGGGSSIEDTAVGTDDTQAAVPQSDAETGTGADNATAATDQATTESAVGTDDASGTNTLATATETGAGSDDTTASSDQSGAETATGTDDLQWTSVNGSGAETAAGADDATLAVSAADTEVGSGTDGGSVTADTQVADTDAGNGADDASVTVSTVDQSDADAGTGADAASISGTSADASDFATSTDDALLSSVTVDATSDTANGADAAFLVETRADVVESAAGVDDAQLLQAILSDTDSGSGTDSVTVDTGGLDGFENATGAEDAAVQAAASDAEAGTSSDSALVTVDQTGPETASGTDAGSISAEVADADSGSGLDSLTTTSTDASDADSATSADDATLTVGVVGVEPSLGSDDASVIELGQDLAVDDTALGADSASVAEREGFDSGDPLHPPRKPPRRIEFRPRRDPAEDELELIMLGVL